MTSTLKTTRIIYRWQQKEAQEYIFNPVVINGADGKNPCELDILIISSYSGSQNWLKVVDVQHCRIKWQSPAFVGAYQVKNNEIYTQNNSSCL
jgi:hypothetical protein